MLDILIDGKSLASYGFEVIERPSIPIAEPRVEHVTIMGRDGTLTIKDGTYENIEFSIDLNYLHPNTSALTAIRGITPILLNASSLVLSDDSNGYYKVKSVRCGDMANDILTYGQCTVHLVCEPFRYWESGKYQSNVSAQTTNMVNPGNHKALPLLLNPNSTGTIRMTFYTGANRDILIGTVVIPSGGYMDSELKHCTVGCGGEFIEIPPGPFQIVFNQTPYFVTATWRWRDV